MKPTGSQTVAFKLHFRDDSDHLAYLTNSGPFTFYVEGNHVYYTDGVNANA